MRVMEVKVKYCSVQEMNALLCLYYQQGCGISGDVPTGFKIKCSILYRSVHRIVMKTGCYHFTNVKLSLLIIIHEPFMKQSECGKTGVGVGSLAY